MSVLKDKMLNALGIFSGFVPTTLLLSVVRPPSLLPFYHAISDDDLPHIKHLYAVKNVDSFIRDLDFLLQVAEPVDCPTFVQNWPNHEKQKKPLMLLSFDDGLREFHDVIAPILKRKGIPATCFLNSAFVDNRGLFFRYKASLIIEKCISQSANVQLVQKAFNNRKHWKENLLSIRYQNRFVLDQIAERMELDFNEFSKNQKPYLSKEQIRKLIKDGFHFGGHSADHPEYQYLTLQNQVDQTMESVQFVTETFGLDYRIFSFPFTDFGVSKNYFQKINQQQKIDLSFGCAGLKGEDPSFRHVQRIPFENGGLSAKQILHSELLYFLLKKPFGKNIIKRNLV